MLLSLNQTVYEYRNIQSICTNFDKMLVKHSSINNQNYYLEVIGLSITTILLKLGRSLEF